jgi:hypothetical protein
MRKSATAAMAALIERWIPEACHRENTLDEAMVVPIIKSPWTDARVQDSGSAMRLED